MWLTEPDAKSPYRVRAFLRWAHKRDLALDLTVPLPPKGEPHPWIDDDFRWQLLDRLLNDETISLDLRFCGGLNLAFGTLLSRSCVLTTDRIVAEGRNVYLMLGKEPLLLPPDLASIALRQAHLAGTSPKALRDDGKRWLVPGQNYASHISVDTIGARLADLGVDSRVGHRAAQMHLAAEVPPSILSRLLGIHPSNALVWSELAGNSYADYVARRRRQQSRVGKRKPSPQSKVASARGERKTRTQRSRR